MAQLRRRSVPGVRSGCGERSRTKINVTVCVLGTRSWLSSVEQSQERPETFNFLMLCLCAAVLFSSRPTTDRQNRNFGAKNDILPAPSACYLCWRRVANCQRLGHTLTRCEVCVMRCSDCASVPVIVLVRLHRQPCA